MVVHNFVHRVSAPTTFGVSAPNRVGFRPASYLLRVFPPRETITAPGAETYFRLSAPSPIGGGKKWGDNPQPTEGRNYP